MLYKRKYGVDQVTQEVLAKEISVLEEVLQNIDSYELEEHWKMKLNERHVILTNLKKAREANERRKRR